MIYPQDPKLFFGTNIAFNKVYDAMIAAFKSGYKYFDFADVHENDTEIGRAIADWFSQEGKDARQGYFFQSKIWVDDIENDQTRRSINRILQNLKLDYIDCLLIQRPSINLNWSLRAWEELISHKEQGLVQHIGVSNFDKDQIIYLWEKSSVKPECNQIEFNVKNQRWDRVSFCLENNIGIQAYGILSGALNSKRMNKLSDTKKLPIPSILISWLLCSGISPIVSSTNNIHIYKNYEYRKSNILQQDILEIYNLNKYKNIYPETFSNSGLKNELSHSIVLNDYTDEQ